MQMCLIHVTIFSALISDHSLHHLSTDSFTTSICGKKQKHVILVLISQVEHSLVMYDRMITSLIHQLLPVLSDSGRKSWLRAHNCYQALGFDKQHAAHYTTPTSNDD